jgi:peptidyl-Lys metalloendopeptidase
MDTRSRVHLRLRSRGLRLLHSLALLAGLVGLAQPALAINVAYDASCNTAADRLAVANAVTTATTWSNDAYNLVNNNEQQLSGNPASAYRTWFGTFSQDRYQRVRAVLDGVRYKLASQNTLLAHCRTNPAAPCDGAGDIAATYINARGDIEAWFCNAFFNLHPNNGFDTQAGTVVHELSHSIGHTVDVPGAYGTQGAAALATNRPSEAVENADNYEYFVEQLY